MGDVVMVHNSFLEGNFLISCLYEDFVGNTAEKIFKNWRYKNIDNMNSGTTVKFSLNVFLNRSYFI